MPLNICNVAHLIAAFALCRLYFPCLGGPSRFVELWGNEHPKMQMLTVGELLDGKRFNAPTVMGKHSPETRMPGLSR